MTKGWATDKEEPFMAAVSGRSIWSGTISFGLVSTPVKLFVATESNDLHFRQVCRDHGTFVKMPKVCEYDGHAIATADIVKGFQVNSDTLIVLEPGELETLPLASSKEFRINEFVPVAQVLDPIRVKDVYYVGPDKLGMRPYLLLVNALAQTGKAGVGKIALRGGKEHLAALTSDGTMLQITLLAWDDEVRDPSPLAAKLDGTTSEAEVAMAVALVESMAGDFVSSNYSDDYSAAVNALVEAKVSNTPMAPQAPEKAPAMVDLMAALRASVEARTAAPARAAMG